MSDKNAPVDAVLDMILVEMAEACIAGNVRATADAGRKAHARLFAAVNAEREACAKVADETASRKKTLADKLSERAQNAVYGEVVTAEDIADDIRARR